MKVALNQKTFTINQYKPKYKNVSFCGNAVIGQQKDSFENLNNAKALFEKTQLEFSDKINLTNEGNKIKIPNCIMFEVKNEGSDSIPIEWLKKTADCNFVQLTDTNNDDLMDNLDEALKKSKDTFEQTKKRTLIHVEGFDRLIARGQNSFENIESVKDIIGRAAKDFGATIVFSTKDASKLTSEAIQPHRITKIIINSSNPELAKYNAFLDSRGYFKDYEKRITSKPTTVSKPEVKKVATEVPSKQVEQPKSKAETEKTTVQGEKQKTDENPVNPVVSEQNPTESTISKTNNADTHSSEQKSNIKTGSISTNEKNGAEIKTPKTPDVPPSKKLTEKASKGSKTFKALAILFAVGAAIAGAVYFMKNKIQQAKEKSSKSKNINLK